MQLSEAPIAMSSDVISLVNVQGKVLYASASSGKVFGYLPEELVGRAAFDLIHPEDCSSSRRALQQVLLAEPPSPRQLNVRVRRKDGEWCWVESTLSNLLPERGIAAILVHCRAISARRDAREQKQRDAEMSSPSIERIEHFVYSVAHDLREPLRTISMFVDLLVKEATLDARGHEFAHFIKDSATRMETMLEGMRAFAVRGLDDSPRTVDLGSVAADALKNLGHAIKASGAIVTVDPLPCVHGHEGPVLRVFQNLIMNAIKYRSQAPVEIHVSAEPVGPDWLIRVKDNGIGIPPEYHVQIFQFLKRLHGSEISGHGIGLAICEKIIKAMGGTIWVESEPGSGSTFCFTIAAAEKASAAAACGNPHRKEDPIRVTAVSQRV